MLLVVSGMYVRAQEPVKAANTNATDDAKATVIDARTNTKVTTYEKKYTIYFRVNESELDPDYQNNAQTLETMIRELGAAIDDEGRLSCHIDIAASASPEGRYSHNEKLSERRMDVVLAALRKNIDVTDVTFHTNSLVEDWSIVAAYIAEDQQVPCRQEVLQIINNFDGQQDIRAELQKIGGGAYDYILNNFFPLLRSTKVVAVYDLSERFAQPQLQSVSVTITQNLDAPQSQLNIPPPAPGKQIKSFIKLKTNLIGIGLGHANIAVEYAFAEHFSVVLPFYYSGGFDYLKETLKFRGIVLQPELRWYPAIKKNKKNNGFFLGAHFGLGWYNFALDGDYRVQDHGGNRPAYGGGLGLGYALQFKKRPNWEVEFTLGGGVYDVLYDTFYNENNGPYNEKAVHDVWFGIDNAAISFSYNFDLKKKGGKK